MLGLMSAISRRERMEVVRQLDSRIATVLRPFSLVHQRQETYRALQLQATALPQVVDKIESMMERIEKRSQQLDEQLLARQAQLHDDTRLAYTGLAEAVGTSLQESLAAGAKAAGESITPVVESAMARIVQDTLRLHERVGDAAQTHVETLTQAFEARGEAAARRDHLALQDRTALLERHGALLQAVNHASDEQRAAIEGLVASAASMLDQAGRQFAQVLDAHAGQAAEVAVHVNASAVELASLGETFSHGVQAFQASNDKLMETLKRIETSLKQSTARSDEQLAYYVAQAREVIDLSIASQQGMVDKLHQLQGKPVALVHGARG